MFSPGKYSSILGNAGFVGVYCTAKIPHRSQITRGKGTNWKSTGDDVSVLIVGGEGWLLLSMKNSVAEYRREFLKRLS